MARVFLGGLRGTREEVYPVRHAVTHGHSVIYSADSADSAREDSADSAR